MKGDRNSFRWPKPSRSRSTQLPSAGSRIPRSIRFGFMGALSVNARQQLVNREAAQLPSPGLHSKRRPRALRKAIYLRMHRGPHSS